MQRKRHSHEEIRDALRQAEAGTPVADLCQQMGITSQTFRRWRRKFADMEDKTLFAAD
ncbi:MAG: transposase [Bacteroidetes bacterium]|nr:transposase [Bacteroidota bacterium]